MTLWYWVLAASLACLVIKLVGFYLPESLLANPRVAHVAGMVTVALLAALVVTQAFGDGQALTVDARLAALVVAAIALLLRAPFLVVVILGAAAAALTRLLGWG